MIKGFSKFSGMTYHFHHRNGNLSLRNANVYIQPKIYESSVFILQESSKGCVSKSLNFIMTKRLSRNVLIIGLPAIWDINLQSGPKPEL